MIDNNERGGLTRVLLVYRLMIPSIRLCGHCQLESLAKRGHLEYRAIQEMRLTAEAMSWAQIVVLGRLDSRYELRLAQRFHDAGRRMIYILDDDLLNIAPGVSSADYYAQPEIQANIRAMIEMSDAILTPSPLLAEKYARDGRVAIMTEEPALDPIPYAPHGPDAPVKIGFAGSIDRTGDLEAMLGTALRRIHAEYGERVRFEFFGAKPDFIGALDARHIPYRESYDDYRHTLNESAWDIGLAPIPVSDFNACKHYNKFCEYAAAGIVGVYSDCLPYTRIPDRARYGKFCPEDSGAWYAALKALIDNHKEREELRASCAACAREVLNVDVIADRLLSDLMPLAGDIPSGAVQGRGLTWLKLLNLKQRFLDRWHRYGLRGMISWFGQKCVTAFRRLTKGR